MAARATLTSILALLACASCLFCAELNARHPPTPKTAAPAKVVNAPVPALRWLGIRGSLRKAVSGGALACALAAAACVPPPPTHVVGASEVPALAETKRAVQLDKAGGRYVAFIDEGGNLFAHDLGTGRVHYLQGKARSVFSYGGTVVFLRENGSVDLWDAKQRKIGNLIEGVEELIVSGHDLLALTKNGQIWRYKGQGASFEIELISVGRWVVPGKVHTSTPTPMVAGRTVELENTGIKGAERLFLEDGVATVALKDGRHVPVSTLAP